MASFDNQGFITFVRNILRERVHVRSEAISKMTSSDMMKIWAQAFTTHKFASEFNQNHPRSESRGNLERLETLGDSKLKAAQTDYLDARFSKQLEALETEGKDGAGHLTFLRQKIEDKDNLQLMAKRLGFKEWINGTTDEKTINLNATLEDVFEAFVGALYKVFEKTGCQVGDWYPAVRILIKPILDQVELDFDYKPPKMEIKELFERTDLDLKNVKDEKGVGLHNPVYRRVSTKLIDNRGNPQVMVVLYGPDPRLKSLNRIPYSIGLGFKEKQAQNQAAMVFMESELVTLFPKLILKSKEGKDIETTKDYKEFEEERLKLVGDIDILGAPAAPEVRRTKGTTLGFRGVTQEHIQRAEGQMEVPAFTYGGERVRAGPVIFGGRGRGRGKGSRGLGRGRGRRL